MLEEAGVDLPAYRRAIEINDAATTAK